MKKRKKVKVLVIILVVLALIALGFFGYNLLTKDNNNYSYSEKKWISENDNKVIDLFVNNELPIFAYSGEGVYYEFIEALEKDTNLNFNTVTSSTNYKFDVVNETTQDDIVFFEDHFVVITDNSKNQITSLNDLKGKKVGVLSSDVSYIKYYLSLVTGISYTSYETLDNIEASMGDTFDYAIVPLYSSINKIITQNYSVVYHIDDLNKYYVLSLNSKNNELNSIFKKFHNKWNKNIETSIGKNLMEVYYDASNTSEINKQSLTNKDFIVGYTENLPFEGSVRGHFTGITNQYLDEFSKLTGVSFKYNEYRNYEALESALDSNNIDLIYNYKNVENDFYSNSVNLNSINYVVLANNKNNVVIKNIYGLKGYTVKMLKDDILTDSLSSKNIFTITEVSEAKNIVKKLKENDIIILEKEVYNYYKNKLNNFSVRYESSINLNNNFLLSSSNSTFNEVFNFFLSITSTDRVLNESINNTNKTIRGNGFIGFIIDNKEYFICGLIILAYILYKVISKKQKVNRIKKEDKLIYRDKLTNLKNRNFLNDNIDIWDQNKIFPQAVITVDLNQVKYINDTAGHEEGDRQIQAAANILIKNQRENSEIIRTDGNEFLIYLVGYEEKIITAYINRLSKEFKKLPYNYGASLGYSMITSEIKSIDDAINDALQMMRSIKGENNDKTN